MKKMIKTYWWITLLLLTLFTLSACGNSTNQVDSSQSNEDNVLESDQKQSITLRVGSGATPEAGNYISKIDSYFIPQVNKALESTGYEINWIPAYGGTVAKLGEELGAVENNILDLAFIPANFNPDELPLTNIGFNVPFSSSNPRIATETAINLVEKYSEISDEYERHNQILLGITVNEDYNLITQFPVNTLEDIKGNRIAGSHSALPWIQIIGGVPVQGNVGEAYQSLQSGVYSGMVMSVGVMQAYSLHEQANHLTEVGFGSPILGGLTINKNVFEGLPVEIQEILLEVGKGYSHQVAEATADFSNQAIENMINEGAIYNELPLDEKTKWMEILMDAPNNYAKKLNEKGLPGYEFVNDYIRFQEEAGHTFHIQYEID